MYAMTSYMPEAYKELVENCEILEGHYKDMMVRVLPLLKKNLLFNFFDSCYFDLIDSYALVGSIVCLGLKDFRFG